MSTNVDTSFLKSLGWKTQYTLEEGLKEAVNVERTNKVYKN
jgi:nucleoside-diphosphate-sugar epimerase